MKKRILWNMVLLIGICPFVIPFLSGLYHMSIESWTMADWLILYSFLYWPTYLIGALLIVLAVFRLKKRKPDTDKRP